MSTILKALRRIEQQKPVQPARPLREDVAGAAAGGAAPRRLSWPRPPRGVLLGACAALVLTGLFAWWLWPRASAPPPGDAIVTRAAPSAPSAPGRTTATAQAPAAQAPAAARPAPAVLEPAARLPEPSVPAPGTATGMPLRASPSLPPAAPRPTPAPPRRLVPGAGAPLTAHSVAPPAAPPARASVARAAAAPEVRVVAPAPPPGVAVLKTVWHPDPARREALVRVEGLAEPLRLTEGDAVGSLVVREIEPSGVVFLRGSVELRERVRATR